MPNPKRKDGVTIEFRNQEWIDFINALAGITMADVHANMGEEMRNITEERFDSGVDPWGRPWKPIKPYIYSFGRFRRRRTASDTPLKAGVNRPPLSRSFNYDAYEDRLEFGTPLHYAKYHTDYPENSGAPREVITLREFLGVELDKDYARLIGAAEDAVAAVMDAA